MCSVRTLCWLKGMNGWWIEHKGANIVWILVVSLWVRIAVILVRRKVFGFLVFICVTAPSILLIFIILITLISCILRIFLLIQSRLHIILLFIFIHGNISLICSAKQWTIARTIFMSVTSNRKSRNQRHQINLWTFFNGLLLILSLNRLCYFGFVIMRFSAFDLVWLVCIVVNLWSLVIDWGFGVRIELFFCRFWLLELACLFCL